jgi:hypothetical protein
MAPLGSEAALTFGAGNSIYFVRTEGNGTGLGALIKVADTGALYLGRHRGPRVAVAGDTLVVSAIAGQKGRGQDGDLLVWTSADKGRTWRGPIQVSQPAGVAREGLHGMAARGSLVFVAWLDLRDSKTQIYGALSRDAGATWSPNILIYRSPSGAVCECCHPTVTIDRQGHIVVMFRNFLEGNRDMYIVRSTDGGLTFSRALKLGEGFWPLNACPMDGGDIDLDERGEVLTVWRRGGQIFLSSIGGKEKLLGDGKNPSIAVASSGPVAAWESPEGLVVWSMASRKPVPIDPEGKFPHLVSLKSGKVLGAWESQGKIRVELFP